MARRTWRRETVRFVGCRASRRRLSTRGDEEGDDGAPGQAGASSRRCWPRGRRRRVHGAEEEDGSERGGGGGAGGGGGGGGGGVRECRVDLGFPGGEGGLYAGGGRRMADTAARCGS